MAFKPIRGIRGELLENPKPVAARSAQATRIESEGRPLSRLPRLINPHGSQSCRRHSPKSVEGQEISAAC
jgi:hypothetical protein